MSIHVSWGNAQKSYLLFRIEGKWTWEQYHDAVKEGLELTRACDYTVNILINLLDSPLLPQNSLSYFGSFMRQPSANFDFAVIVTSSRFVEVLGGTIEKMYGRKQSQFRVVRSLEKAHQLLAAYDAASVPSA